MRVAECALKLSSGGIVGIILKYFLSLHRNIWVLFSMGLVVYIVCACMYVGARGKGTRVWVAVRTTLGVIFFSHVPSGFFLRQGLSQS